MKATFLLLTPVALFIALAGCGGRSENPEAAAKTISRSADGAVEFPAGSPQLTQIRVDTVKDAEVPFGQVVSTGKIQANPNRTSRVMLPVQGRIAEVLVGLGDSVKRGQTVVTIESPDADAAESAYLQAQAGVTQAKANLNKAQADADRTKDLFQHDAVAKKDVLTADNALAVSQTAAAQAEAALEQCDRRLRLLGLQPGQFGQRIAVTAPVSGKVLEMNVAPGEYHNDTNAPLMTITDLSSVWVSSDVPESDIHRIKPGERIDVTLSAYPGEVFHARVTRLSDTVDPQTRTIKVLAELDNRDGRLRPEMFGEIRHTEAMRQAPVVLPGAVMRGDGRSIVWVERAPGHFAPVEVKTGERAGDVLPVLSGLKEGDRVVVDGAMLLKAQ